MMLEIDHVFGCRWAAALLQLVSLQLVSTASLPLLGACSTEVEIFRLRASRGPAGATAASSPNSTNILITPVSSAGNSDDSCKPGHYVGAFNGVYYSAVWGNGSEPLSIAATDSMGRPGLEFWLEQIPHDCRSDEEFCAEFTVRGGKIRGNANPFSSGDGSSDEPLVIVPFEIDFAGDLDCSRGTFRGLLQNGCYDFATLIFRFEGTAPAHYDPATASFTDGNWAVKELAAGGAWVPPDPDIGGMGEWEASLVNDNNAAEPAAEGGGLCDL